MRRKKPTAAEVHEKNQMREVSNLLEISEEIRALTHLIDNPPYGSDGCREISDAWDDTLLRNLRLCKIESLIKEAKEVERRQRIAAAAERPVSSPDNAFGFDAA
jgi:hypothetical protein